MIEHWMTMGMQPFGASQEDRLKAQEALAANTKEARAKRKAMFAGYRSMNRECNALGAAYSQRYESSAIVSDDEPAPFQLGRREAENKYLFYDPCTFPGPRLPHVWLSSDSHVSGKVTTTSTLDLAGKGQFCLFTGIGGDEWLHAAQAVEKKLGVKVNVVRIGIGLEWSDLYLQWDELCGVEEDECVLVRPDFFVAWRAQESGDAVVRLDKVMRRILGMT